MCPQNAGNAVLETQISKWDFKPIYFAQEGPQNAGNAVSETQISNPLKLCRHYGLPLIKILATSLLVLVSILRHFLLLDISYIY